MSKWIGYAVSVNCGEPLGCYQGTILEADGNTITLTKAFRNGFPYPKSQVTLNAADIKELKIIEARADQAVQPHSTVAISKACKKQQRATVCENLQANPSNSGNQVCSNGGGGAGGSGGKPRSKPIDIQARPAKNPPHAGSYGNSSSTPKSRGALPEKARRRNEACFGEAAHPALDRDFDFEGNLALFDKRALWEQMNNAHKPDLVRQTDDVGKFRHDENVLGGGGAELAARAAGARRGIRVPDAARGPFDYVTDDAVCVPSATPQLRRRLWEGLHRLGLAEEAHTLAARAVADVVLRLVGGGRRLDPRNAHQAPTVVALAGPHGAGAAGLRALRLLASHGARVACLVSGAPRDADPPAALRRDLAALALDGVRPARSPAALPSPDAVVVALHDELAAAEEPPRRHAAALAWAGGARAALVALEPPPEGWAGVALRAAVLGGLPAALAPALGRVYLADVAPPVGLFAELGVLYRPPFGACSVLALHPAD